MEKTFIVKRSFSDNNPRTLTFNENFLKFEDKDIVNDLYTSFKKGDILDYRFGIRWMSFKLIYGREYQIFVRNRENKTIKISFKSYFGRKKQELHKLYIEILDELWINYFSEMADDYLDMYHNNEKFSIGDVQFTKDGIDLDISGILNQKRTSIAWENIRTKNYFRYFAIYSSENPSKINRGYYYKEDWNTNVLYCVLRTILKEKKIETYE